jgi:hypothetical protein
MASTPIGVKRMTLTQSGKTPDFLGDGDVPAYFSFSNGSMISANSSIDRLPG